MLFTISCCQPANQSAISLNNSYSASFDDAKDAAYTAKYGQPPEMKQGRGRGKGKGREGREGTGKKEVEGEDGGPLRGMGVERGGRKRREGTGKGTGGRGCGAASWQGGAGEGGRKGKEQWGTNPYS